MYIIGLNTQAFLSYIFVSLKTKYHFYINIGDNDFARPVA